MQENQKPPDSDNPNPDSPKPPIDVVVIRLVLLIALAILLLWASYALFSVGGGFLGLFGMYFIYTYLRDHDYFGV